MIQVLKDCLEIKQKLLTHSRFYLFCWVTLCLTMYTIYTVQQKETWKLSSVDLAPHLHVSPFSTTSSQQVVIFLCTIPGYRDHNSNALFCFFRCTIYCSYCVVQENPWIYFSYLKFRVLTSISPASPFPLPTLPLQPQPPASVFLSAFCILRFHTEVRSGTLLFLCLPACLPAFTWRLSVSSLLEMTDLLCEPWTPGGPVPHFLCPVICWWTSVVSCLAFVNNTSVSTGHSCLFDSDFLSNNPVSGLVLHFTRSSTHFP